MTPIQVRFPKAYQVFVERLREQGLQPYDVVVEVGGAAEDEVTIVRARYGESFRQEVKVSLPTSGLFEMTPEVLAFFDETVRACRENAVKEYKSFMNDRH